MQLLAERASVQKQHADVSVRVQEKPRRTIRVVVVVATPHDAAEERLFEGAQHALTEGGIADEDVTVVPVPGISEIPMAVRCAAETARFDAAICLCSLVHPATPSAEITLPAVAHALQLVAADTGVPFTLGVLTAEAATEPSGGPMDGPARNGYDASKAALEMVAVVRALRDAESSGP